MKWRTRPLGSLATVATGGTPDRRNGDYWGGNIPWVTTGDIDYKTILQTPERITALGLKESAARVFPAGTIVMAMYGQGATRGKVAVLGIDAATNQACAALLPKRNQVDPGYFYSVLVHKYEEIRKLGHGSHQKNLNTSLIRGIPIPVPAIAEQKDISRMANTWVRAIEKTERLVATKKRRNDALSRCLLFGKVRLGGRTTTPKKMLHWFEVPAGWPVVKISDIANEVSLFNSGNEAVPVLSCTKYDGLVDSLKYFEKQVFSHDTSKYKVVKRGQFAYATNHIEEGSIGYQDLYPAGLVSPIYTVFAADPNKIDDGFLHLILKTEKLRQIFEAKTNASVDRRGSLRWKDFAPIQIPLPSLNEQREICELLSDAKREVELLQTQVDALRRQMRGLMHKLLTSEWRVNITGAEVA